MSYVHRQEKMSAQNCYEIYTMERGGSVVECRTRNRASPGSNAFATVSKSGHFRSLHDASADSAV